MNFLTASAWLDQDGRHVWLAHDCQGERKRTMLPYPRWHAVGDKVEPSISCDACGLHYFATLEPRPLGD